MNIVKRKEIIDYMTYEEKRSTIRDKIMRIKEFLLLKSYCLLTPKLLDLYGRRYFYHFG